MTETVLTDAQLADFRERCDYFMKGFVCFSIKEIELALATLDAKEAELASLQFQVAQLDRRESALQDELASYESELEKLRATQRTPGTYESCLYDHKRGCMLQPRHADACEEPNCPIKSSASAAGTFAKLTEANFDFPELEKIKDALSALTKDTGAT